MASLTPLRQRAATAVRRPGQLLVPNRPLASLPGEPEPRLPHWDPPYPWAAFATHAAINEWVEAQDLIVPEAWFVGTLAEKKAWLAERYG